MLGNQTTNNHEFVDQLPRYILILIKTFSGGGLFRGQELAKFVDQNSISDGKLVSCLLPPKNDRAEERNCDLCLEKESCFHNCEISDDKCSQVESPTPNPPDSTALSV